MQREPGSRPRTVIRRREAGAFRLTEASYAARAAIEPHEHRNPTITLVVAGACLERFGPRTEELTPVSVLIKPAGLRHRNEVGGSGARGLFISARPGDIDALCRSPRTLAGVVHHEAPGLARLGRRVRRAFWDDAGGGGLAIEQLLLELLAEAGSEAASRTTAAPAWLGAIRDRLVSEFVAPPSLTALACEAGVHATYLGRAFRRHYGIGPAELVHRVRVERAAAALTSGVTTISQIAFATGFADQSHLGRIFKRFMGVSPAAYRRTHGVEYRAGSRRAA